MHLYGCKEMSQSNQTQPPNQEESIVCSFCDKEFEHVVGLCDHLGRDECEGDWYECSDCSQRFEGDPFTPSLCLCEGCGWDECEDNEEES